MSTEDMAFVSIIIPCRNEEKFIREVLMNLISQDYDKDKMEILIADAMSSDNTRNIIAEFTKQYNFIRVLDNPKGFTPVALNIAIKASKGDPIIRIDAHTKYADDYVSKILETFKATGSDIVGGPMRPVGNNTLQLAIASATSASFGIGDSRFHNEAYKGYVDSVYLGAWKRKVFEDVGYFDENLVRNQDDEFHYRAKSLGKKIYLNPEIRSWYYPRADFASLIKQYFQYGLYKPYVLKKIKSEVKLRHLIPIMFVLYLLSLPLSAFCIYWLIPFALYLILDMVFSITANGGFKVKALSLCVFPLIHLSYGTGFLLGLFRKPGNSKI
ncbi:MAG TPA: glycosyltransferase family 2 protein [Bacteroidia bacterium]|jgi:succinoglycan biosynthesis protein ExoA|nr:glycosyltransferase family 2 protein [Bacteroidia bacterium]